MQEINQKTQRDCFGSLHLGDRPNGSLCTAASTMDEIRELKLEKLPDAKMVLLY